jgi:hypothetical protein
MDAINEKLHQVRKVFLDAPGFIRPQLLPVLQLLELLVVEIEKKRGCDGK